MLLLPDENSDQADKLWSRWQIEGASPVGPSLLYAEVSSVLRESVFFGRISLEEGDLAFEAFCGMGIAISPRPDLHLLAWDLTKTLNRPRTYDSFYLAVAQAEGCDLWTGDKRLVNAVGLPWVKWIDEA